MKLSCEFDKVYIRPGFIDGRKGLNCLLAIITNDMKLNPCDSAIFLFCTKNRRMLRMIYWDKKSFWYCSNKSEQKPWPWPTTTEEATELTEEELQLLLRGIDFWKGFKEIHYEVII